MIGTKPVDAGTQLATLSTSLLDSDELLRLQRRLKRSLLDSPHAIRWHGARDLAAYMLLSIDEPSRCWSLALDFLRQNLGVERVDGGFASPYDEIYRPGLAECRSGLDIPSLQGMAVNNQARSAQLIWYAGRPLVHDDMEQDVVFDEALRQHFLSIGTMGKMTSAVVYEKEPIGLVCVDRMGTARGWLVSQYDCFDSVTHDVMAPILHAAKKALSQPGSLEGNDQILESSKLEGLLPTLSKAELQVCLLVAGGMSYKEIGVHLNRSFSTVDHHLRRIRIKLQVRSTRKLVSALSALQSEIDVHLKNYSQSSDSWRRAQRTPEEFKLAVDLTRTPEACDI